MSATVRTVVYIYQPVKQLAPRCTNDLLAGHFQQKL